MAPTPPNDPPPSGDDEADDVGPGAAAARAAREDAIRALLEGPAPDIPTLPRRAPTAVPEAPGAPSSGPVALAQEPSLPVIPSAARLASVPFTLFEVGLGLLSLVLAAALVSMGWSEVRGRLRAARCAAELRELAAAFEHYRRATGEWPAAATPGTVPPGMDGILPVKMWTEPTPLGGHFAWIDGAGKNRPALAITAFVPDPPLDVSRAEQERIDRLLDDGDLTTGRFQAGFNGWPVYFLTGTN